MNPKNMIQHDCCSDEACEVAVPRQLLSSGLCPQSGSKGKRVDGATVKAMLSISLTVVRDVPYYFCRDEDCPVVYFNEGGTQIFTTDQVREHVYQKEPDSDEVFVCYCFRHTPGSIRAELIATGESTVIEAINMGIQAGQCACDIRNPQGACCLGNVSAVVKEVKQSLKEEA